MNNVTPTHHRVRALPRLAKTLIAVGLAVSLSNVAHALSSNQHAATDLPKINVNEGFSVLVDAVKPAVVNISVTGTAKSTGRQQFRGQQSPELEEFFRRFFGPNGPGGSPDGKPFERKTSAVGSGFIISEDGYVVTNNHVIEDADEIEVVFDDGKRIPATLKGTDQKTDIALLKMETDDIFPFVAFGDSDDARVGDWVVAIGNPFGLGGTTTKGIISARGRDIRSGPLDDFIQIDAPINRGNSGGPLFNLRGEVIGINSMIYSPNGGSVGIGFAIPSSLAKNIIGQLRDKGTVDRGFLGVQIQTVSEDIAKSLGLDSPIGALVSEVIADSPADDAGVQAGDVITEFDGKKIARMRDLPKVVALTPQNTQAEMKVWRNNSTKTLSVIVGGDAAVAEDENGNPLLGKGKIGLSLAKVTPELRAKYSLEEEIEGVIITNVNPKSAAAQRGIREGDILRRIGSKEITTPKEVGEEISKALDAERESVLILVETAGQSRFVAIPLND